MEVRILPPDPSMKTKHIELNCKSLAECLARAREMVTVSDLMHRASVVIDIDTDSKPDTSYIKVYGD